MDEDVTHADDLRHGAGSARTASPMIWRCRTIQFWMSSSSSNAFLPRTAYRSTLAMASITSRSRSRGFLITYRLPNHAFPDAHLKPPDGHDIYFPTQQLVQVHEQSTHIEQALSRLHLDEEINVAFLVGLTAGKRTGDLYTPRAMLRRNLQNLGTLLVSSFSTPILELPRILADRCFQSSRFPTYVQAVS